MRSSDHERGRSHHSYFSCVVLHTMKAGDLIKDTEYPEVGLLAVIKDDTCRTPYGVLCPNGRVEWFTKAYIKESCEVVSESR